MIKIVLTIGRLNYGGAERRLLEFCAFTNTAPVELWIFVISGQHGDLDAEFQALGVNIEYGQPGPTGLYLLWRLCRRIRPRVLHINAGTAAGFYALSGYLAGVRKRIGHFHSTVEEMGWSGKLKKLAYELLSNIFCTQFIGVSDGTRVHRRVYRPWTTLYNGVNIPEVAKEHMEGKNVLILGRVLRTKNVDRSITIFAQLVDADPRFHCRVVGPFVDVSLASIESLIKELNIAENVTIVGAVDKPFEELELADVLLTNSTLEGMPGVVQEALACGVPVVGTDIPGIVEIAQRTEGVTVLPYAAGDDVWTAAIFNGLQLDRARIRSSFRDSVFTVPQYSSALLKIWGVPGKSSTQ